MKQFCAVVRAPLRQKLGQGNLKRDGVLAHSSGVQATAGEVLLAEGGGTVIPSGQEGEDTPHWLPSHIQDSWTGSAHSSVGAHLSLVQRTRPVVGLQ